MDGFDTECWVRGVTAGVHCLLATRFCQPVFIPAAKGVVTSGPCALPVYSVEPTL
jgi:hypothetical protein